MPKVLVPLADGFEEIEAVCIIDVLRRADIEVITAGLNGTAVTGSHSITIQADALLDDVIQDEYDLIALAGGMPGAEHLKNHNGLQKRLQQQAENGQAIAAICAAPMVLDNAGLLEGHAVTSYPGFLPIDRLDYREDSCI